MGIWIGIVVALVAIGFLGLTVKHFSLWLQAIFSGLQIGLIELIIMSLRQVDVRAIVECQVMAIQSGIDAVPTQAFESLYLSGGDIRRVTVSLIAAHRAGIRLDWQTASAMDLAGRDILKAVQISIDPITILCPTRSTTVDGFLLSVAKDGIQLGIRVRVTVRTNLEQIIGGATEETIVARVGQSTIAAIGSCSTYLEALGDPAVISRRILSGALDSQTAYSILSIDIEDISVVSNIGAKLSLEQAEADIRISRANAESRRALAVARQQEMQVRTAQSYAAVVVAESTIPASLATAIRRAQFQPIAGPASSARCDAAHLTLPKQLDLRLLAHDKIAGLRQGF